jgi:hypothetical protein
MNMSVHQAIIAQFEQVAKEQAKAVASLSGGTASNVTAGGKSAR